MEQPDKLNDWKTKNRRFWALEEQMKRRFLAELTG